MRILSITAFILLTLFSCNSKKRVLTQKNGPNKVITKVPKKVTSPILIPTSKPEPKSPSINTSNLSSVELYIAKYSAIAMTEMQNYGIPASITLAQGILESGSGKGRLSVEANNHFGIKCHGWKGEKIYHDDDASQECFRKYKQAKYSYRDHSLFLKDRKRYSKLFKFDQNDYKNWAKELRKAGYATDPKYPNKLISLIERYKLDQYDAQVLGNDYAPKAKHPLPADESISHKVKKGDTLYAISKKYNTSVELIKSLNKMNSNALTIGQNLIIKL